MIYPCRDYSGRLGDEECERVNLLHDALLSRLAALAAGSGKSAFDVQRASNKIFWALH
jgi:hypothetical protein